MLNECTLVDLNPLGHLDLIETARAKLWRHLNLVLNQQQILIEQIILFQCSIFC